MRTRPEDRRREVVWKRGGGGEVLFREKAGEKIRGWLGGWALSLCECVCARARVCMCEGEKAAAEREREKESVCVFCSFPFFV